MEKTLKREIGYKPEQTTKNVSPTKVVDKKPPKTTPVVVEDPKLKALKIVVWLKAHPFFAWGRMCVALGIDKGNFKRTLDSENPSINENNIVKIENALKNYGYGK